MNNSMAIKHLDWSINYLTNKQNEDLIWNRSRSERLLPIGSFVRNEIILEQNENEIKWDINLFSQVFYTRNENIANRSIYQCYFTTPLK